MPARYGSTGIFYLLVLSRIGTPKKGREGIWQACYQGVILPGAVSWEKRVPDRTGGLFTDNLRRKQQGIQEKLYGMIYRGNPSRTGIRVNSMSLQYHTRTRAGRIAGQDQHRDRQAWRNEVIIPRLLTGWRWV
jgi:hypothetical protein